MNAGTECVLAIQDDTATDYTYDSAFIAGNITIEGAHRLRIITTGDFDLDETGLLTAMGQGEQPDSASTDTTNSGGKCHVICLIFLLYHI